MCGHITCSQRCARVSRALRYFLTEPERKPPGGCGVSTRPRKVIDRQAFAHHAVAIRSSSHRALPGMGAIPGCDCWFGVGLWSCPIFDSVSRIGQHLDHRHSGFGRPAARHPGGFDDSAVLARQVVAARVRDAMDYEVTRAGMVYMAITLVIGIASINTGNNLLYIAFAALL